MSSSTSQNRTADCLLRDARDGRSQSLGKLLQLYANYLKILASAQLDQNLRGRVSPSDVVQETLFEAHRDFAHFRGTSPYEFVAWLRRIMVHNLASIVEQNLLAAKRDVRREVSLQKLNRSVEQSRLRLENILVDRGASPSSNIENQEQVMNLADVLSEMPADYRDVIVLRNLEGLGFKDVADRMSRSHGAVRMLWMRAIEDIRCRLSERGWL